MSRDDVIKMAQEANRYASNQTGDSYEWHFIRDERFAALVAAAERERCAKIADAHASIEGIAQTIAAEIRRRNQERQVNQDDIVKTSSTIEIGSKQVNDACWAFIHAMPHTLPGPIWNDLKPAVHAAICNYLAGSKSE